MNKTCFSDRRDKILQIAATDFHSSDDAAQDYLAAIEGASLDEQKQLFQLVLGSHKCQRIKQHQCPTKRSISPNVWQEIVAKEAKTILNWTECATRNNAPLKETADEIWDQLTLFEGDDRIVALGMILDSDAVPYMQIPRTLLVLKPRYLYDDARAKVQEQIALLMRVENCDHLSTIELAVAIVRIIDQIDTHEEKVAFLLPFLEMIQQKLARSAVAERVVKGLGEAIYQDFLRQQRGDHHDEENGEQEQQGE
jgi:hypothetical protein